MKGTKRNRLKGLLVLVVIFSLIFIYGPRTSASNGDNFLWEVESQNNRVYILGSIHLAKEDIYPLSPIIEESFAKSEYLVVEADIQDLNEQAMQRMVIEKGLYTDGSTLRNHISDQTYNDLIKEAQKYGMNPLQLNFMKPWVISVTLEILRYGALGYDPEYGIDNYFITKATGNKDILELESAQFQLDMLSSFSAEIQEMALKSTLESGIFVQETIENIFRYWEKGNSKGLEELIFKDRIENPELEEFYKRIFDERNYNMRDKIIEYLADDKDYFVVVGAGHLVGEEGIIDLLEEAGYKIEQL